MTYAIADVGARLIDGVEIPMTDAEKQAIADEWNANDALAATERAALVLARKRAAALEALQAQVLAAALQDPAAPAAVKDYAAELQRKN